MNLSSNSIASYKQTHVYEREMDIKSRIEKMYGKSSSRFLYSAESRFERDASRLDDTSAEGRARNPRDHPSRIMVVCDNLLFYLWC